MTVRGGLGRGLGALLPSAPSSPPGQRTDGDGRQAAPSSDLNGAPHSPGEESTYTVRQSSDLPSFRDGTDDHTRPANDTPSEPAGGYFTELPVSAVRPNPRQPRQVFDGEALAELAESVALVGLLQPVIVRPAADGTFELVMGERRWRAAQLAGLERVPAIVRKTPDIALLRDALVENLHRAELNPLEEAAAYSQLLDDFSVTHEELAGRLGRSRPHITNTLRLLRLTPPVQRRVAAGVLSAGHARALVAVTDADRQDRLATQVVAQGLSVRALEELVAHAEDVPQPKTRARRASPSAPELDEIADRLSERFETRCRVDLGKRRGKITIEFASVADLHRIIAALGSPD